MFSESRFLGQGNGPWRIKAKQLIYRHKEGIYDAEGEVTISRGGMTLYAQKALYNTKSGIAEVEGKVRLVSGEDTLSGEKGVFNFKEQTGRITKGSLFLKENHFYAKGNLIEKQGENTYRIKDCLLTTCDAESPVWSITGSEVNVTLEGYGTVKHAALRIKDIPVLYVPYMIFPAKTERQSGLLLPRIGHSSRNGLDVEVPFFWATSNQTDMTFYQRYLSRRGYMQGLEFRYVADQTSKGNLLFNILSDKEDKNLNDPDDANLSPYPRTNDTRYWLRGKADQDLPLNVVARLDGDYVSDQDYLNEFDAGTEGFNSRPDLEKEAGRAVEEKRSPIRTSVLRLSRDTENYSIQGGGGFYQLPGDPDRDEVPEPAGSLFFSRLPSTIASLPFPAFFDLNSDYDYVWRNHGEKGHRSSVSPRLRFPFHLGRYVEFEPSVRYTLNPQWFDEPQGENHNQVLKTFEAGATLSTTLDRIFQVDLMGAERLKHRLRPTLGYEYRDFRDKDFEEQTPWFEPVVAEGDANQIFFGIENFLNARLVDDEGNVSYRQWAKFTIRQGYDVEEKRRDSLRGTDREPFAPLNAELTLTPFPNLNVFSEVEWDHYDSEITFVDFSLALTKERFGNRKDRFQFEYLYNVDQNNLQDHENINLWFDVNLTHGLSAGSSLAKGLKESHDISNKYWLQYQNQCWGLKVTAEREDDNTSVMIQIQLLGLGNIGFN